MQNSADQKRKPYMAPLVLKAATDQHSPEAKATTNPSEFTTFLASPSAPS